MGVGNEEDDGVVVERGLYLAPFDTIPPVVEPPFWCCCADEVEGDVPVAGDVATVVVRGGGCGGDCCLLLPLLDSILSCIYSCVL